VTSCEQIACQLFVCKIREGDSTPSITIRAQHFRDSASECMLSLTIVEKALGPEQRNVATPLNNLAELKKRTKSSTRSSSICNNVHEQRSDLLNPLWATC
jgi:hypothetical protein